MSKKLILLLLLPIYTIYTVTIYTMTSKFLKSITAVCLILFSILPNKISFAASAQTTPTITVTSPNGGENWPKFITSNITWTNTGSTGANVKIDIIKNGISVGTATSSAPNTGSFSWTILSGWAPGTDYKIKITSIENPAIADMSDADFTISGNNPIQLGNTITYQWLNDKYPQRTIAEKIAILKELKTDTVYRGFWYCPEAHCSKTDTSFHYYTEAEWTDMENTISAIKIELPNLKTICGFGPRINTTEIKNYETGEVYNSTTVPAVWDMYLDPAKWGLSATKEQARTELSDLSASDYTNPAYYQVALSRAKKFIDAGCDGIWLDELYKQSGYLYKLAGKDITHPAVIESYNAATNLVADIKRYQASKGKEQIVGSWFPPLLSGGKTWFPNNLPNLDFFVINRALSRELGYEIINPIDVPGIQARVQRQRNYYGPEIKTIYFIDDPPAITALAQCLDANEGKAKLTELSNVSSDLGITFAYPVHGQWMIDTATRDTFCPPQSIKKSYGLYSYYDSKAPEFQTYNKIRKLMTGSTDISFVVNSPNGGESWIRGTTYDIKWTSVGDPGANVKIELLKNGASVGTVTSNTSNDGLFSWTPVSGGVIGTDFKIKITSLSDSNYQDTSDNNFILSLQPTPTSSPAPAITSASITIHQHGIGSSGDNTNPDGTLGNKNPLHPIIEANLELFNTNNQLVARGNGPITYNNTSGNYQGVIGLSPNTFPSGNYYLKIKTPTHLKRLVPGILAITAGQKNTVPATTLVTGDSNNDNRLNILDYNLLSSCYSDLAPATSCDHDKKLATDFNDDSFVNQADYNLFLREIAAQTGK